MHLLLLGRIGLTSTGWFPVQELMKWPRMRSYTEDTARVISVTRYMPQLVVSINGRLVRRATPIAGA
jgi:hypothetical protein|eukprot:7343510-Prymnesium_polylepis.1